MDSGLKQRLLGAAVLIALAIIFVPMFLGNAPPRETSAIQNLDIPPLPERKFETRTLPVEPAKTANPPNMATPPTPASADKVVTVETKAPASFEAPDKAPDKNSAPAPAAPAKTSAPPAPEAKPPTSAEKPAESSPPPAPAAGGRFTVNLGVYADQGHADALVERMKKAGYSASSEAIEYQGKPARRVRVGPYADRAAAEAARLKIKQADPKLPTSVSESADASATDQPATAMPSNRAGGWAVQLGAFKSEAEANKLRDRARGAGVATFVDKTGSEQPIWRVRAGPYTERPGAEAARATLKTKLQTEGVVVTLP